MTVKKEDKGQGGRVLWAVLTPVILLAAALSIAGIAAIPALCVALDRRSGTYTGAVSTAAASLVLPLVYGPVAVSLSMFLLIATTTVILCVRRNLAFRTGLAVSAGGGVLGMMAALAMAMYLLPRDMDVTVADNILKFLTAEPRGLQAPLLDAIVVNFQMLRKGIALLSEGMWTEMRTVAAMPVAEKAELIRADLERMTAQMLPALALNSGLLIGSLGYYLGRLSIRRQDRRAGRDNGTPIPPFQALRFPNYIVFSLVALQLLSVFGMANQWSYFETVNLASSWLLNLLMTAQSVALCSFFLNRWRVAPGLQALIFVVTVPLLGSVLVLVGLSDVVFDFRSVAARVDAMKKGGPPNGPQRGPQ